MSPRILRFALSISLGVTMLAAIWFTMPKQASATVDQQSHGVETAVSPTGGISQTEVLTLIGSLSSGLTGAEITAHDPQSQRLFVTSGDGLQVIDMSDPTMLMSPTMLITPTDLGFNNDEITSVAVSNGIIAVAVPDETEQLPGDVLFLDADGNLLASVEVGALPDMLTFTPDGTKVLVANEGEPGEVGSRGAGGMIVDPEGSVSIIDISMGFTNTTIMTATFTSFNAMSETLTMDGMRLFDGKTVAEDVEPEYIAVSADSSSAFVALQEANAVGVLDIDTATFTAIVPLGTKDYSIEGNGIDASDRDSMINIQTYPVLGMYMPDAIAAFNVNGTDYYITANEGDDRGEDERIGDLMLDPTVFPNAAMLQMDEVLGRLGVSTIDGDTDGDGDYDELHSYGARSFTIWDGSGNLIYDSGDDLEQITAVLTPDLFNANNGDPNDFDTRSDNKGPEPEGVVTGVVAGRTYAFIGLERAGGGVMVYEVTSPTTPDFVQYVRNPTDISPEGLAFIAAEDSPTGKPLLVVSNEVSNSISIFEWTNFSRTFAPLIFNN